MPQHRVNDDKVEAPKWTRLGVCAGCAGIDGDGDWLMGSRSNHLCLASIVGVELRCLWRSR
jgi:hypothetical protein